MVRGNGCHPETNPPPGSLSGLMRLLRRHPTPLLLIVGYALIGFAWVYAMPSGTPPDADAHYTRAIAMSRGDFVGQPYSGPPLDPSRFRLGQARVFRVPAGLAAPSTFDCVAGNLDTPSICSYVSSNVGHITSQVSVEGTTNPLAYLLPALVMRLAKGPNGAELLGSIASLLTSLGLLAAAAALLWSRRVALSPLIGLAVTTTPTVLFLAGALGPDGLESSATICFVAGLMRLSRDEPPRAWMFMATAMAGFVLALDRSLGFGWVIVDLALWALLFARRQTLRVAVDSIAARIAVSVIVLGLGLALAWGYFNPLRPYGSLGDTLHWVPGVFDLVPQYIGDFVGRFGFSDTPLPQPLVEPWLACLMIVVGIAVAVGSRRERVGIVAMCVLIVLGVVGYAASFDSLTGGGLPFAQARHVLPLALLLPLFAGEIVARRAGRLGTFIPSRVFPYCAAVAAIVNVGAFYYDARRYAVGNNGSLLFFLPNAADWAPKGQWLPPLLTVLLGGTLIVVAAIVDTHHRHAAEQEADAAMPTEAPALAAEAAG